VKVLRDDVPSPLARREVAALLALDLPGVVRLYDDGRCPWEGGGEACFLVMELVQGEPFFPRGAATWAALRGPLVALLRVLRRVHAAGVVHRDLKPANILRRGDEVVLLDLGVAAGEGADAAPPLDAEEIGDEGFMAPEQLREPERVTPAADLYAVGMIVYEALTGRAGPSLHDRLRAAPPPDPRGLRPALPEEAVRLVTALLQPDLGRRPATAEATLALLDHDARSELNEAFRHWPPGRPPSRDELQGLFQGPERLLRRRSRALALLERRSIDTAEDRAAELSAWIAAGRARWDKEALDLSPADLQWLSQDISLRSLPDPPPGLKLTPRQIELHTFIHLGWPEATRSALVSAWGEGGLDDALATLAAKGLIRWRGAEAVVSLITPLGWVGAEPNRHKRLARRFAEALPPEAPSRLRLLLFAGITVEELQLAQREAEAQAVQGDTAAAVATLDRLLRAAREHKAADAERSLHHSRAWIALSQSGADPVARGLYELARSALPLAERAPLESLLRAAQLIRKNERDEGLALLDQTPPFDDERLDRWRFGLAVEALNHEHAEARSALLVKVDAWALARGTPSARADSNHWRVLAQDTTEEVEAAARLLPEVIQGKATRSAALSSLGSYAVALMELRRFDEARAAAERLMHEGGALGLPVPVVIGEFVRRACAYREGQALTVDWELVVATEPLRRDTRTAQLLLNEAAIAWRAGDRESGAALARSAAEIWRPSHSAERPSSPWLIAQALAAANDPPDDTPLEALTDQLIAAACPPRPGLALQGLGVLIHSVPRLRDRLLPAAKAAFERTPTVYRRGVREILDVERVLFGTPGPSAP
jgi:serine/threonine protein kinase